MSDLSCGCRTAPVERLCRYHDGFREGVEAAAKECEAEAARWADRDGRAAPLGFLCAIRVRALLDNPEDV